MSAVVEISEIFKWAEEGLPLINKLMEFGLLPKRGSMFCPNNHTTPMVLYKNGVNYKWHCEHSVRDTHKKKKKCGYRVSLNTGTFFAKAKLTYGEICKFIFFWLDNLPLTLIRKYSGISGPRTSVDWASFCREVTFDDLINNKKPIGGVGRTVELDESKFGKRKYHRGKRVEGQWVFGGYERETGCCFMVAVERRDAATLIPLIEEWVVPGTTIITDFWKSYDCISDAYEHLKVNHSVNFKDPETGAHTNSIEGSWAHAKKSIPPGGRRKHFMPAYLAKFMYLRRCKKQGLDPFKEFCRIGGILYDATKPSPTIEMEESSEEASSGSESDN